MCDPLMERPPRKLTEDAQSRRGNAPRRGSYHKDDRFWRVIRLFWIETNLPQSFVSTVANRAIYCFKSVWRGQMQTLKL